MSTHNPFNHLRDLSYLVEEGDGIARLALLELINQLNLDPNPYFTALEASSFEARVMLAVYGAFFEDYLRATDTEDDQDERAVERVAIYIMSDLREHITTTDIHEEIYNLSLPDMDAVLAACATAWSDEEVAELKKNQFGKSTQTDEYNKKWMDVVKRPAKAISEHFTVRIHKMNQPAVILHVGKKDPYPLHARAITAEIGPYHMTWRACKEWGLTLPKHSWFADNNDVACEIVFPDIPEGVRLRIASSEDNVPDPDNPGQMKKEKLTATLEKDKLTALSFTNRGLRYHEWRIAVKEDDS